MRALAAPGVRTSVGAPGLRADVSATVGGLRDHPFLLVIGMIGFALRGGILLLTAPILVLPTAIEVRFLLGDNLGSTGLTPGFFVLVALLSAATLGLALLVLYGLARCELAAWTRFVNSTSERSEYPWPAPGRVLGEAHRLAVSRLFVVDAIALLAILVAAVPLAAALGQATLQEVQLPSSSASIYTRIVNDVMAPLIIWIAAIVVIESVSAVVARRALAGAFSLAPYFSIARRPWRAVVVGVIGWALFIGAVALSFVALSVAWEAVESTFLSTGLSGGLREMVSGVLIALLFGGLFASALLVCGAVSAFRAGLWTLASLR